HCGQFRTDLTTQQDSGLDEPRWFHWVHALTAAGHTEEALAFSRLSAKHDRRSESRIHKMLSDHDTERAKAPERCMTFGCTERQIAQCHGRLFTRGGEVINSPMDRIRPAGEIPPEADWGDPDEQEPWGKTHAKGFTYPSGVTADDIDNWQTLEAERETSD